jgi:hypothetical protein
MNRCSICHTLIQDGEAVEYCERCDQHYHAECWQENSGCATYGCEAAPVLDKPVIMPVAGQGWGDEKECPQCGKSIGSSMLVCHSCGAKFPHADPMTQEEHTAYEKTEMDAKSARQILLGLFLIALVGVTAPLAGAIAVWYARQQRRLLAGQDGAYVALGYGTGALGAIYLLVIIALMLGG